MDQPDVRNDQFDFAALQRADEVDREAARVGLRPSHEILCAILTDQLDSGLEQRAALLDWHIFGSEQNFDVRSLAAGSLAGGIYITIDGSLCSSYRFSLQASN